MSLAYETPLQGLARRAVGQYIVHHDPAAVVSETSLRRASSAHRTIAGLFLKAADPATDRGGCLGRLLDQLAATPHAVQAFRDAVTALTVVLEHTPSSVAELSAAVDEAEYRSCLTYHLGDLLNEDDSQQNVADELVRLAAPSLNPDKLNAELAVIVPVSFPDGSPERLRNAMAVLHAVSRQCLDRSRYRIVVVEQGARQRGVKALVGLADDYLFAPNPGAFNKSWGLNIGVNLAGDTPRLCLLDGDALLDEHHLATGLASMRAGLSALLPFSHVLHLDAASSCRAIRQRFPVTSREAAGILDDHRLRGFSLRGVNGFCIWVSRDRYRSVGGHDERYRGWGDEDNEFISHLSASGGVSRTPGVLRHLWHPRPTMTIDGMTRPNAHLRGTPRPPGEQPLGDTARYLGEFGRSIPA